MLKPTVLAGGSDRHSGNRGETSRDRIGDKTLYMY